jgi:hypothetical protein
MRRVFPQQTTKTTRRNKHSKVLYYLSFELVNYIQLCNTQWAVSFFFLIVLMACAGADQSTNTGLSESSNDIEEPLPVDEISFRDQLVHYSTAYYEYDEDGRVIFIRQEDSLGSEQSSTEYKYDDRGNVINLSIYQSDGIDQSISQTFDSKGNIIERKIYNASQELTSNPQVQ